MRAYRRQPERSPYKSVTENADGTFTIVWDKSVMAKLGHTDVSDEFVITFPTKTLQELPAEFPGHDADSGRRLDLQQGRPDRQRVLALHLARHPGLPTPAPGSGMTGGSPSRWSTLPRLARPPLRSP